MSTPWQRFLQRLHAGEEATKVVCLSKAIFPLTQLQDDGEYEDILEDMAYEGCRYGNLVRVVIPRPFRGGGGARVAGVGKVFLEYADAASSGNARRGLNGRKYAGNGVAAVFYPENRFAHGDYDYDGSMFSAFVSMVRRLFCWH